MQRHLRVGRWLPCLALFGMAGCGGADLEVPSELPSDGDPAIASLLEPIVREFQIPALAGAVVTSRGLETAGTVGLRKWGLTNAVRVEDLWHLGSETKAMTAALAGRVVERGELRWETRVDSVFPDQASQFHEEAGAITLEQLLTHRAGLPANLDWSDFAGTNVRELRLAVACRALAERPLHAPGTRMVYSNLGYVVVGAILERTLGRTWEELMAEWVFVPLGMREVGYGGMGVAGRIDQPWGHTAPGTPVSGTGSSFDNPPVMGPAGRVHASIADWAKFIADQLRGARGEPGLLSAESYSKMQHPPAGHDYAMGWAVTARDWGGGRVLMHTGCNTMHFAVAWLAPKKDFAVLVCCNQGDDTAAEAADRAAWALIQWHTDRSSALRAQSTRTVEESD